MAESPVARFYDRLAADYHRMYADWEAGIARQGASLDALIRGRLGDVPAEVLDCACGIGTQSIGLAARGHRVTATDLSAVAAARAAQEADGRGLRLAVAAADMRRLPVADGRFDVVVCADNALPHLLAEDDVLAALGEMRRALRPGGLLLLSTRPYDELRAVRPSSTPPQVSADAHGRRTVTFQLWQWHEDGERYDLELFQLTPAGAEGGAKAAVEAGADGPEGAEGGWHVEVRRSAYWALSRAQLTAYAAQAGFTDVTWELPERTGFFQPVLIARVP
ncbi:class I SAM-dependent methyltransferase [Kitasatospora sp. NPDC047058]|uniref:class I SAM-dependent methyltransferase n=1 Tax=Kitasatospora sp. NPDC047058 TaxID=3155620 RepID=UPI0033EB8835